MSIKQINYFGAEGNAIALVGPKSDPKPTQAPVGSTFLEYDSGLRYVKTPVGWRLEGGQTIMSGSLDERPAANMVPENTTFVLGAATPKIYFIVNGVWTEVTFSA